MTYMYKDIRGGKSMPKKSLQTTKQLFSEMEPMKSCSFTESKLFDLQVFQTGTVYQPAHIRKNGLIFTEDSLQWLKTLQDESVDLIFADPPYNIKKRIGINLIHKKIILNGHCNG